MIKIKVIGGMLLLLLLLYYFAIKCHLINIQKNNNDIMIQDEKHYVFKILLIWLIIVFLFISLF